jgi:hypothetical protein
MIAVFDNFIQDENLLKEIEQNKTELFKEPGVFKWYDGWWNSPATNTAKKVIQYAWGEHCPISRVFEIAGFEYWTGIQKAKLDNGEKDGWNDFLEPHFDKDEAWHKKTGEIVTPIIGSVYYPEGQEFEGGELHVYSDGSNMPPEIIKAKPNRFIIFQAGQHVHTVKTVTKGTRRALAINLWEKEPYSKQNGILTIEQ